VSGFTLTATDGPARAGIFETAHGSIPTPAFMPVGTKATVKTLHPDEVREVGASVVLANAYHLHFRPGADVVRDLGGLHAFSGWSGPILTDSGGFQVFSLRDTILALDESGVTFRSVYDGAQATFTPEGVADIQRKLGSDIAMCLDVCPPADASEHELERAVQLTTHWAERQVTAQRADGQLRFGIAQGSTHDELRRRSIDEISALPFDGYALGGSRSVSRRKRCSSASPGRQHCSRRTSRATSWASGIPRESSRSLRVGSTCSTAFFRHAPPGLARRSSGMVA